MFYGKKREIGDMEREGQSAGMPDKFRDKKFNGVKCYRLDHENRNTLLLGYQDTVKARGYQRYRINNENENMKTTG
jgi:hypothetical protein